MCNTGLTFSRAAFIPSHIAKCPFGQIRRTSIPSSQDSRLSSFLQTLEKVCVLEYRHLSALRKAEVLAYWSRSTALNRNIILAWSYVAADLTWHDLMSEQTSWTEYGTSQRNATTSSAWEFLRIFTTDLQVITRFFINFTLKWGQTIVQLISFPVYFSLFLLNCHIALYYVLHHIISHFLQFALYWVNVAYFAPFPLPFSPYSVVYIAVACSAAEDLKDEYSSAAMHVWAFTGPGRSEWKFKYTHHSCYNYRYPFDGLSTSQFSTICA